MTGGVDAGLASIQASVSATASASVTAAVGNTVAFEVPANSTIYGEYGTNTIVVRGENVQYSGNCNLISSEAVTITAPTSVGWRTYLG